MQKEKGNLFLDKFQLLNSQENSEEILWTSSDSSESDSTLNYGRLSNSNSKPQKRKRKQRKKVLKNATNLDVTIIDIPKDIKHEPGAAKHQQVVYKSGCNGDRNSSENDVLSCNILRFPPSKQSKVEDASPILTCKVSEQPKRRYLPDKSPILTSKFSQSTCSPEVRKKLFKPDTVEDKNSGKCVALKSRSASPILLPTTGEFKHSRRKSLAGKQEDIPQFKSRAIRTLESEKERQPNIKQEQLSPESNIVELDQTLKSKSDKLASKIKQEIISQEPNEAAPSELVLKKEKTSKFVIESPSNSSDSFANSLDLDKLKNCKDDLGKQVKSFFKSHFGSESPSQISQLSIAESLTPQHDSKTSDEIEIINFVTQINSIVGNSQVIKENQSNSLESSGSVELDTKSKKIKYKKDGLSYRLTSLLKKQNANISLWQHEKFLAENSNFLIPKGEHLVFRIQKVEFKYGCFLIQGVDLSDDTFLILVNNTYVLNNNFAPDMILKLYEPFQTLNYKDCKLLINICKFECIPFKL